MPSYPEPQLQTVPLAARARLCTLWKSPADTLT
eukprot:CAMPEP_0202760202 /NCGR_PEP_ID=MMETSP1388-20130828/18214_1 /ASSEMBLY_ACC=CAM_ASM_000864 /TAXON_ID=37098 /ORGANISM="Isochrysis sp, Strain CCMP1244" /LENGTH=32 /DNA_ID= /DNA_START= /DNA_END= /DNA_ORIENTATION=